MREWNRFCAGMTLEEKVGQLVQYSAGQPTGPGTGRSDYDDMIAQGQIGSLFNVVDPHEINRYQKIAMEKSRLHIPILFGLDVIHGFKTEFPIPLGLASTWDPSHCGESVSRGGHGSSGRRHPMDIFADGRHCARCALGTDGGRRWRGSVSGFCDGGGLCERDIRARDWMRPTALRLASSIMSAMARLRPVATTTAPKFPNTRCGSFICRRFTRPSTPGRHH